MQHTSSVFFSLGLHGGHIRSFQFDACFSVGVREGASCSRVNGRVDGRVRETLIFTLGGVCKTEGLSMFCGATSGSCVVITLFALV